MWELSRLQLHEGTAVFIGDATERRMHRVYQAGKYKLWSDYKKDVTAKVNGVCIGNGYLCEMSPCWPGGTPDGKLMTQDGLAFRISKSGGKRIVFLYDRGLTQGLTHFYNNHIVVLTPRMKGNHQVGFSPSGAGANRVIASNRVMIEHIFGHCRKWRAFDDRFDLKSVGLADTVNELTRCLVNLLPPPHKWLGSQEENGAPMEDGMDEEEDEDMV